MDGGSSIKWSTPPSLPRLSSPPAATIKTSSQLDIGRNRNHLVLCVEVPEGSNNSDVPKRIRRPPRRSAPQRRTGLSNTCPPLDGPTGAPELPVLTTKDASVIERWLEDHIGDTTDEFSILGFDVESIAKPPWKPERASLPDGPATIQLSTPKSCIIIQLSRCGDGSALCAPDILRRVINNPRIIKVGVGIDDDALELYRWSKQSFEMDQLWEMRSRFDLGCILHRNPSRRSGIRELAHKILGVEVSKSKKLTMSNWGNRHLTIQQISYAARDAWVSAAIVERLQKANNDIFQPKALVEMEFMKSQRSMDDMDERARLRKLAKQELNEMRERQKSGDSNDDDEERKQELYNLLDIYRPGQPPTFPEDAVTLPLLA